MQIVSNYAEKLAKSAEEAKDYSAALRRLHLEESVRDPGNNTYWRGVFRREADEWEHYLKAAQTDVSDLERWGSLLAGAVFSLTVWAVAIKHVSAGQRWAVRWRTAARRGIATSISRWESTRRTAVTRKATVRRRVCRMNWVFVSITK